MRAPIRGRKYLPVYNFGPVDEYRYGGTSSLCRRSRKGARVRQVRAELPPIRPPIRAHSTNARAFAKTGEPKQANGNREHGNRPTAHRHAGRPDEASKAETNAGPHKCARSRQVRAELPMIRAPFREHSTNARAFAKTGEAGDLGNRRRLGRRGPGGPGGPGENWGVGSRRSRGDLGSRASTAAVCGICCRGTRLGSLHSGRPGNVCAATLLRGRPRGFAARWWCRATRWPPR